MLVSTKTVECKSRFLDGGLEKRGWGFWGAVDVPPCSGASRPASLFGLDPPSARRLTEGVGTLGVPLKVRRACGASNTGLCREEKINAHRSGTPSGQAKT
jgi:hypothetical protein